MEDRSEPEEKEEPTAAVGVEEQRVVEGPHVSGEAGVTTDRGGASWTREPCEGVRQRLSGGGSQRWKEPRSSRQIDGLRWSETI